MEAAFAAEAPYNRSTLPRDESHQNLAPWSSRWANSDLGWHRDKYNAFLLKYGHLIGVPSETQGECFLDRKEPVRIFVPLCGKSLDLRYLANHSGVKEVVGIDGVRKAILDFSQENQELEIREVDVIGPVERFIGKKIALLRGDYFDMDSHATQGTFDSVFDRASMVAIRPELRSKYVDTLGKLIEPKGSILLVTYDRRTGTEEGKAAGPPYSVNEVEVRRLYESLEWVESVTLLEEVDEFADASNASDRWLKQGLTSVFDLCFLIRAK